MKKFVFRLQVVLDRALEEEERLQQRLAVVQREQAENRQAQERVEHERQRAMAQSAVSQRERIDVLRLQGYALHLDALASELADLQAAAREIAGRVQEAQRALMAGMRKRQTLETLRDKQHANWRKEFERQESNMLSEVALQRRERALAEERRRHGEGDGDE